MEYDFSEELPELREEDFTEEDLLQDAELCSDLERLANGDSNPLPTYQVNDDTSHRPIPPQPLREAGSGPNIPPKPPKSRNNVAALSFTVNEVPIPDSYMAEVLGNVTEASLPPPPPSDPAPKKSTKQQTTQSKNVSSGKSKDASATDAIVKIEPPRLTPAQEFENILVDCAEKYLKEAQSLKKQNKLQEALESKRKFDEYKNHLTILRTRMHLPNFIPPQFHWKSEVSKVTIENKDVGDDQMKILIESINEMDPSKEGKSISIHFQIGYTSDSDECLAHGETKWSNIKGGCCELKHIALLNVGIKRGKINTFGRKKARLEIFQSAGLFGMSKKSLGVAVIAFTELGSHCTISGVYPLQESDKRGAKNVCGTISVSFMIRRPLMGTETIETTKQTLVVGEWPQLDEFMHTAPSQHPPVTTKVSTSPTNAQIPSSSPTSVSNLIDGVELSSKEISDPFNIDFLVSNDVIENEISLCESNASSSSVDETDVLVLSTRALLLKTKLYNLQKQVEDEKLTIEEYMEIVRNRLSRDKALCKYFILLKDVKSASRLKRRIDIMVEELKGVEQGANE